MDRYTRREFLDSSLKTVAGLVLTSSVGCGPRASQGEGLLSVPPDGYPLIEVAGSYHEIGRQLGSLMKMPITEYLELSPEYQRCLTYLQVEGRSKIEGMVAHVNARFPHLVEEVEGMAEGLGIPFLSLFAYNCRSEIDMLTERSGCSTIALRLDDQMILAHNEDGNDLNVGRMYLAKVKPPSGVSFLYFVYPGLIPGNAPGFNEAGIAQTTNYIQPREVADGIPRYFISRAILEARSLDEALDIATTEPRAFPWHHNLVSFPELRLLSVETVAYPSHRHHVREVEGIYVHTNHLLHPGMTSNNKDDDPPFDVPYESSTTRLEVLSRALETSGRPSSREDLLRLLSLHEGRPYSPCRHPAGDVHGATLGTAIFEALAAGMTLYHGNPCYGIGKNYTL